MPHTDKKVLELARQRLRATWSGLTVATAAICGIIFGVRSVSDSYQMLLIIGGVSLSTIGFGVSAWALTHLAQIDNKLAINTLKLDPFSAPIPWLHKGLLGVACVVALFFQLTLIYWYIEDAAISFSFARNFANGEGFVTYVGGERVEGYSNPLWTFLLSIGYLINIDGFTSSKALGLLFGVLTVPIVYDITRYLRPEKRDATPLIAAFIVATDAQFSIWGASGLENSLFNLLLACGIWRVLKEAQNPQLPLSAACFLGLAVTRPEGILYAAFGGFWFMFCTGQAGIQLIRQKKRENRRPQTIDYFRVFNPTIAWLALFFGPFIAYHWARWNYFNWEFPNTYYAKKGRRVFEPFSWNHRGWKYLRNYAHVLWQGYLLPVYLLGMFGEKGIRRAAWWAVVLVMAAVLVFPAPDFLRGVVLADYLQVMVGVLGMAIGLYTVWATLRLALLRKRISMELIGAALLLIVFGGICLCWWTNLLDVPNLRWRGPKWWITFRVVTLVSLALLAMGMSLTKRGWRGLGLCWGMAFCALFFALYATGDWMKGYRWMSSLSVPAASLLAVGLATLADWVDREFESKRGQILFGVGAVFALCVCIGIGVVGGINVFATLWPFAQLWPLDAVMVSVLIPCALVLGATLGISRATRHQWKLAGFTCLLGTSALVLIPDIHHMDWFTRKPETGPFSVRKRVNYNLYLKNRLHLEQASMLDVDMGATMYWSGFEIIDIAGLVDVSMGHHWMEKPFIKEYIFEERKPDLAHVHGAWANTSKLPQHPEWARDYIEVPGYPTSKKSLHLGNHVRRDLLMDASWNQKEDREVTFENGVRLRGWKTAGLQGAPGKKMYLEVALQTPYELPSQDFRLLGFISSDAGELKVLDIPPGYDWYAPHKWGTDDIFVGRYSWTVPKGLPHGRYDLGFALMANDGTVVPVQTSSEAAPDATPQAFLPPNSVVGTSESAHFAVGEIRFLQILQIASTDDLIQVANNDIEEALQIAKSRQCERAEVLWSRATRRLTKDKSWISRAEPTVKSQFSRCWTHLAMEQTDREKQVQMIARARRWQHWEPTYRTATADLVPYWMSIGLTAREEKDWETAYSAFRNVLAMDTGQSKARRYAEEARDYRLKIDPETKAAEEAERKQQREDAARRREERRQERKNNKGSSTKPFSEMNRRLNIQPKQPDIGEPESPPSDAPEGGGE